MRDNRFGVALVGLGMASKPHALALKALASRVEVIGAYARRAESRERFRRDYGFSVYDDLTVLAQNEAVDGVIIMTPPNARKEVVELFAAHGKHILTEKPVERNGKAASEIVKLCADAGVTLGVVFQHRFREASEKLAEWLAQGVLGPIRLVRADIPWWRDQSYYDEPGRGSYARDGGGVLISQAIHTLDLMLSYTGPVRFVQAHCATTPFHKMESEDFAAGTFGFTSGAIGSFFASTAIYPGDTESLSFECDQASVLLKAGVLTIAWRDGRKEVFGHEASTGGGADPMAFPFEWHRDVIADFVDAAQHQKDPRVTGAKALKVHRLIEAIETSSRQGCKIEL